MKRVLCLFFVVFLFSGCGNAEIEKLKNENLALQKKVNDLEKENRNLSTRVAELSETDENRYRIGADLFKAGVQESSIEKLEQAKTTMSDMILKYPNSTYKNDAAIIIEAAEKAVNGLKEAKEGLKRFESALASHNFDLASAELEKFKEYLQEPDYQKLNKRIDEEKNKPLETTINKLVSEFGSVNRSFDISKFLGMRGKRVKVPVTFTSISRDRKALDACSDGWGKGSRIEIFYEGTNLEEYFTNTDPKCCENQYVVTGKLNFYSNTGDLYIKAEKIDVVKH